MPVAKVKSFVSFSHVTGAGVKNILERSLITPGKDPVYKGNDTVHTAAAYATMLDEIANMNTLYSNTGLENPALLADLQAKAQEVITAAGVGAYRASIKVALAASTQYEGIGAYFLTVKTPVGKQIFEYPIAD